MILLTALFLMGVSTHLPGLSSAAIFYFAWGAYMSLHKISMGADAEGMRANLCGWIMLASLPFSPDAISVDLLGNRRRKQFTFFQPFYAFSVG